MNDGDFFMIYTTYFANLRHFPDTITPIAICGGMPNFFKGPAYKKLAPKHSFFKKWKETCDNDQYIADYNSLILAFLDPAQTVSELKELADTEDIALVCYEKPSDFCHRHLVADWLNANGYRCEEWKRPNN